MNDDIKQYIDQRVAELQQKAQYDVPSVPFHVHNGTDSPTLPFDGLVDVPHSYSGQSGKVVTVNTTESGLTFTNNGGAASITVKDGLTTVNNVSTVKFTGGATVSTPIAGEADVAIASAGTPAGANTQVQYNDNGSFGGDANFTWDKTLHILEINDVAGGQVSFQTPAVTGVIDNCGLFIGDGDVVNGTATGTVLFGGGSSGSGTAGNLQLVGGSSSGTGNSGDLQLSGGSSNNAAAYQGRIVHLSGYEGSMHTYTPISGGTATIDLAVANEHRITMPAGNITIAIKNDTGAQKFLVSITQDAGGSRLVSWFTTIRWAGGVAPTLTTTPSKRDTFGFIRTGSGTYDGFVVGQNI